MPWPHAPSHTLKGASVVMVTAGVYRKENFFKGRVQLEMLHSELLTLARKYEWQLEAWAVFANHYHWVGRNDNSAENLESFINHLHSNAARGLNELDGKRARKVWHNYWDTPLTYRNSYYARLHYVHANAVHHGLARVPNQYRWCSASWFENAATPAQVRTIYGVPIDSLNLADDF